MIDAPTLTMDFLSWVGCTLPVCESAVERVNLAKAQAKGVVVFDQRFVIAPGKKVEIDGQEATVFGYDPCGVSTLDQTDAKRCVVFGEYSTTAPLDIIRADGSSTTELWGMHKDGSDLIVSRPNGDVMFKLPVQLLDQKKTPK